MVSTGPYSQPQDYRFMYDIPDIIPGCGYDPEIEYPKHSLMWYIGTSPKFSKFKYIVKLADAEESLSDCMADITLFIPSDDDIAYLSESFFTSMDRGTAKGILKASTMKGIIPLFLLNQSPSGFYNTLNDLRLNVSTVSGITRFNDEIVVNTAEIYATNGLIHTVDKLLVPYPGTT